MNNDDESFLSAYIDGELDSHQRHRVESALVANPDLAERSREVAMVRDLVASLPHDGSVDVSARVLERIAERRRGRGLFPTLEGWRRGSRRILPLAGLAASAASLMVAASLAILMQARQIDRAAEMAAANNGAETIVWSKATVGRPRAEAVTNSGAPAAVSSSSPTERSGVPEAGSREASSHGPIIASAAVEAQNPRPSRDAEALRTFLDHPNLKRFFWVRNGPRNDSEEIVASIIERTTHFDYFTITVAQGIVIDPRRPEEARVLAFVIDPNQLERFNDQLNESLPGLVEQDAVDPAIATQLADIDRVRSSPPASLGELEIPREHLAFHTRPSSGNERLHSDQDGSTPPGDGGRPEVASTREAGVSGVAGALAGSGVAASQDAAFCSTDRGIDPAAGTGPARAGALSLSGRSRVAPDRKVVVLVWVARGSGQ
jgi:anti-sigma factor RsiW